MVTSGASSHRAHAFEPRSQGFWIEDNVLQDRECDDLIEAVPPCLQGRSLAGARNLMSIPAVELVAKDDRLLRIARRALGDGAAPFRATLFDKSARANWLVVWHQDTALLLASRNDSTEWGSWSTKAGILYAHAPAWALSRVLALRIHLDASTSENGPLRVIPGSHLGGVLSDDEILKLARTRENVEALVPRGGVLAMRPLLVHSSSKARGGSPRRVHHIEYADELDLGPGLRLAIA
ncbi:MAG TPA: phytanoyl-CoA dioxygenase family protein [Blastocatellia bacterium]|nr:phytanoyl-CoA dioxygenase family protein [Blastocatellia bacterium]